MRKRALFAALCFLLWAPTLEADGFVVEPYLQRATPHSIVIGWETRGREHSSVEWGTTRQLGHRAIVASLSSGPGGQARTHRAELTGLAAGARYFYRVRTGSLVSEIADLRTPPAPEAEAAVRLVVMSDMQFDRKQPKVFGELVRQGVMPLLSEAQRAAGGAPAAVLIAGDLLRHGQRYELWSEEFFRPLAPVARHIPLFPVAGNHDEDSPHYFRYFTLPANGSARVPGRWWWADFSNVRVIGLDSNEPYRTAEQLAWLERVLRDTCANDQLDFVFATLHHPEKSELWPNGELAYSGRVARAIERFASACAKPSVMFSGHAHAYARGHSRDHRLTSVGVASAGGDLARIGEYPQRHYVEYVTSQDEYGFVLVDLQAGDDPWFRLRRISRGNPQHWRANELRDEVLVRRYSRPPTRPEPVWPRRDEVVGGDVVLTISHFSDEEGDEYGATHWQVGDRGCNFSRPLLDRWYQRGQASTLESDRKPEFGPSFLRVPTLEPGRGFCYRARVRNQSLVWSEWSRAERFRTLPPPNTKLAERPFSNAF